MPIGVKSRPVTGAVERAVPLRLEFAFFVSADSRERKKSPIPAHHEKALATEASVDTIGAIPAGGTGVDLPGSRDAGAALRRSAANGKGCGKNQEIAAVYLHERNCLNDVKIEIPDWQ